MFVRLLAAFLVTAAIFVPAPSRAADTPVKLKYDRAELEAKWRVRVQSFLDRGVPPLIDLESSLRREDGERYLSAALRVMDEVGIALIAFDGYPAGRFQEGESYPWGYYIHEIVNAHPDRFILATNGGTNRNWLDQRREFLDELERQVRTGAYAIMGEFDFRHYMSNQQCRAGRFDRDNDVPLDGENGHRQFRLAEETGLAFVIHHEAEDAPLDALEKMLAKYPRARVIVAHFGQIRHPEKQKRFGPELVRRLLSTHPNLYYDISVGFPGRRYACNANVLDTVIWEEGLFGSQGDTVKAEYRAILAEFSTRFVVGTDYGGGRPPLPQFLRERAANARLILRDLPEEAKHNIGYRNAWFMLTGKPWR